MERRALILGSFSIIDPTGIWLETGLPYTGQVIKLPPLACLGLNCLGQDTYHFKFQILNSISVLRDFEYMCCVDIKEKRLNIVLKQSASEDLVFYLTFLNSNYFCLLLLIC